MPPSQASLYLLTIVAQQGLQIATNVWLKNWSQHNSDTGDNGNVTYYLAIYAMLGVGASLIFFLNGVLLYSLCVIRSAKLMHDRMFNAVIRSPMLFFETTPLGTILNRFSRDVYVIDEVLARVFGGFARTLAGVFGPSPSSFRSPHDKPATDWCASLQVWWRLFRPRPRLSFLFCFLCSSSTSGCRREF